MDKTIEIKNDFLTVEISALGAEIVRIKDKDGNDRQWNGDPSVWSGRAPIMFPICGGLKNDTLKFGEKEYEIISYIFELDSELELVFPTKEMQKEILEKR